MTRVYHDEENDLHLSVEFDGKMVHIQFPRFESSPAVIRISLPRASAEKSLRAFITEVYAGEEVFVDLLNQALRDSPSKA